MNDTREKIDNEKQLQLKELYESYEQALYNIAYSILHNIEQAEDATHDTFIKIVPYLSNIKSKDSMETKRILVRIVKNVAIDKYRRNHKENQMFKVNQDKALYNNDSMEIVSVKSVEDRNVISQIMNQLDQVSREIIQLRCFYELSYKEIAAILEVSEEVAMKRFQRAKQKVQRLKGGNENER